MEERFEQYFDTDFFETTGWSLYDFPYGVPVIKSDSGDELSYKESCKSAYYRKMASKRIERLKKSSTKGSLTKSQYRKQVKLAKQRLLESDSCYSTCVSNGCTRLADSLFRLKEEAIEKGWEECIGHIENVLLTYFALKDAVNIQHFVSILLLAIKASCPNTSYYNIVLRTLFGSDTETSIAKNILSDFCDTDLSDGHEDALTGEMWSDSGFEEFKRCFGTLHGTLQAGRHSAAMGKISSLLGVLLSLGFISESKQFALTVHGLDIFRFHAAKGQKNAVDLLDALMVTGKFFCERGYKCFMQRSFDPLFFESDDAVAFERDYTRLIANFDFVKIGDYKNKACPWLDENDFDVNLSNCTNVCNGLLDSVDKGMRPYIAKRLENLMKMRADFELVRVSGGLRPAPWSFLVYGTSGIAKSSIVTNLTTFSLLTMAKIEGKHEFTVDPNMICTLNEMDKYHSDYKSHIQAVLLDDLSNARADTTDINPTINIINFVNNIRRTAIMAEAEMKGKIQLQPRVVCATTNVWEKWASQYSNEPVSVLRRFQLHLKARVKPRFQKTGTTFIDGTRLAIEAHNGNFCPDAWEFDVMEFIGVNQQEIEAPQMAQAVPVTYERYGEVRKALNVDIGVVMQIFRERIEKHVEIQKSVVSTSENTFAQKLCKCGYLPGWCRCDSTPVDEETLESDSGFSNFETMRAECERISRFSWFDWTSYAPKSVMESSVIQWGLALTRAEGDSFWTHFKIFSACYISSLWFYALKFDSTVFLPGTTAYVLSASAALMARREYIVSKIAESRDLMPAIVKHIRDYDLSVGKKLCVFFAAFLSLYTLYKIISRLVRKDLTSDGNGMSVPEIKTDIWKVPEVIPLPDGLKDGHSVDDLSGVIARQAAYVKFAEFGTDFQHFEHANALFIDSNLMLIPNHMAPTDKTIEVAIQMRSPQFTSGKNFTCMLSPNDCIRLHPDSDISMCYVARSGDMKNILDYFPTTLSEKKITTRMLYKTLDSNIVSHLCLLHTFGPVKTNRASFKHGGYYNMDATAFPGLCMATHVTDTKAKSYIAGFHLASDRKTTNAIEMVIREWLVDARKCLQKRPAVVLTASTGKMLTENYGIDYTPKPEIPKKSPLRYQATCQADHFGAIPQFTVRPKSSVISSPMADIVEEEMGVKQQWGKPPNCRKPEEGGVPNWYPYQQYMEGAGNAYQEFPADVLEWAVKDYLGQIDRLCDTAYGKQLLARVRPLTEVETVSGIDGMKFVDAMKPNTSMGHPVNKPKRTFLVDLNVEDFDNATPRTFDAETLRIASDAREDYKRNIRAYPVFKACTKDEPTKLTKNKTRVFQAAPASFQFNARMELLTICNFLSSAPLKTECAVGLNSNGPAWHVLQEHLCAFGEDRIVAGDFKAYDQHMSARMVLLSYKVFEHIAERAGYSEEDLAVIRGLATDVSYPVMNLNGELIQLYGSNPSGQNMTVYTNSIVNSLYQRCVFRTIYPDFEGNFEDVCHLTTYGDDNEMGISRDFPRYNHTEMQKVYATMGIEYTMAEKEAESVPYIHRTEADFLKRKSRFVPYYRFVEEDGTIHDGLWLACLDEMSIFKSLMSNLASATESQNYVAVQCLEGAAREWWFHGREVFEERHRQLKRIGVRMGYEHMLSQDFQRDYDQREAIWMERYGIERLE
jgi:hypothetical protein